MANWIAVKPNNHLSLSFLREALEQWGCADKYSNLTAKAELLQALEIEFPKDLGPVYIKVFLIRSDTGLFAINGQKPTVKSSATPKGITSYLNTLESDPSLLLTISNDIKNFASTDPIVNAKIDEILKGSKQATPENLLPRLDKVRAWLKTVDLSSFSTSDNNLSRVGGSKETEKTVSDMSKKIEKVENRENVEKIVEKSVEKSVEKIVGQPEIPTCQAMSDQCQNVESNVSRTEKDVQFIEELINNDLIKNSIKNHTVAPVAPAAQFYAHNSATTSSNISKLLKIPDFDPDKSDVNEWLATAKYAYDLARITDEPSITASILCHLPQSLAGKVRTSLTRIQPDSKLVTVKNLEEVLTTICKKTPTQLERELKSLKYDSSKKFRDLYLELELKIAKLNPKIKDDLALENVVTREFRLKCPQNVRDNVMFRTSELEGLDLAELAESVNEVTKNNTSSNFFQKNSGNKNEFNTKGSEKKGSYGKGSKKFGKSRGSDSKNSDNPKKSANIICYFCDEKGHGISFCEKLKEKKRKQAEERKGSRGPNTKDKK